MLTIWMIGWGISLGFCETKEGKNKWSNIIGYTFIWPLKLGEEIRRKSDGR